MHFKVEIDDNNMDKTFKDINTIAKSLFEFLVHEKDLQNENISLCTDDGSILISFPSNTETPNTITSAIFDSDKYYVTNGEFTIITHSAFTRIKEIEELQKSFEFLLSLFSHNEQIRKFIFDGLDALPNSICIYDLFMPAIINTAV